MTGNAVINLMCSIYMENPIINTVSVFYFSCRSDLFHLTMLMNTEEEALIGRVFETYMTEHHYGDILQLITDANEDTHRSVVVNAMTLFEANMEVMSTFLFIQRLMAFRLDT